MVLILLIILEIKHLTMFYNYRTSKSCKTDCGGSKQIMLVEMPGLWMM